MAREISFDELRFVALQAFADRCHILLGPDNNVRLKHELYKTRVYREAIEQIQNSSTDYLFGLANPSAEQMQLLAEETVRRAIAEEGLFVPHYMSACEEYVGDNGDLEERILSGRLPEASEEEDARESLWEYMQTKED